MTKKAASVTIKDVAQLSGVSPMTVSRVINVSQRVSPETRRRVEQAISELGYVPSQLARGFSRQRTGTLALIVPDVANPFFTAIVRAAEDVARRAGYRIILCDTRGDLRIEREVIEEMIAHRVEGIVIAPVSDRSKGHLLRLAKFGVPFVLVDRTVPGIDVDAILGDSVAGAHQLVDHLISLGHRRIGFIVESDEVSTARDRRRGYESALRAAGVVLDPAIVAKATVDPSGGFEGMQRLLQLDDPPTAVFTVNNLVALGAIEAVREVGLEVPDDVALVCFDDIEYASRLNPFLTVMEQPAEAFGTLGTQLLLDRIEGRVQSANAWSFFRPGSSSASRAAPRSRRGEHDRLRRDRGRRIEMGVRSRDGTCRSAGGGDDPDDGPPGDHWPGRRLFRTRGAGRCDRDRLVRPPGPEAVVADLGPYHDDAEAGLGTHRCRPEIGRRLSVPVAFDTDVNAAALAEYRWGAAQGLDTFCYITVGTGIGGGGMLGGKLLHGLVHPEFGHMRIPHDRDADPFPASAPTTETAGKDSRRAVRSRRAGAGRPLNSPT